MVRHWTFGRRDRGSKPTPPFRSLGNYVHPTLPASFRRDNKSRWSLLSCVYARGSKRSHAGKWKKPFVDSLTLEKNTLGKTKKTTLEISVLWCAVMCYTRYYWIPKTSTTTVRDLEYGYLAKTFLQIFVKTTYYI